MKPQQGESARARTLKLNGRGDRQLEETTRSPTQPSILGSAEDGSESTSCAAITVLRTLRLLPLAFIAEAVSTSLGYGLKWQPQQSQVTSGEVQRTCWNTASQFFQQDRDDERASIVVRRISF